MHNLVSTTSYYTPQPLYHHSKTQTWDEFHCSHHALETVSTLQGGKRWQHSTSTNLGTGSSPWQHCSFHAEKCHLPWCAEDAKWPIDTHYKTPNSREGETWKQVHVPMFQNAPKTFVLSHDSDIGDDCNFFALNNMKKVVSMTFDRLIAKHKRYVQQNQRKIILYDKYPSKRANPLQTQNFAFRQIFYQTSTWRFVFLISVKVVILQNVLKIVYWWHD